MASSIMALEGGPVREQMKRPSNHLEQIISKLVQPFVTCPQSLASAP